MVDRLRVTELDFDTIKQNLKTFLNQQSEFTDYDFEGSGLSVLLDILAYNTHYQAYYLNMVANEAFMDTALLRDSVVSHAKTLGYVPYSRKAPRALINFTANSSSNAAATMTIPKGYRFLSNDIDGVSYGFVTLNETTVTKANTQFLFNNLPIYEGQLVTYSYNHNQSTNPKQIFTLPDTSVDTTTISVTVQSSATNTEISVYTLATDASNTTTQSEVFYLQEGKAEQYQIYFGGGVIGKSIPDGSIVNITYLVTNGDAANKANNFVETSPLADSLGQAYPGANTSLSTTAVSEAAGGAERESVDNIKFAAPLQFTTQNRLVTFKDYETYIQKSYPAVTSVSVWGGEDETPPTFGTVYVALKPKENYFLSDTEKQRIIDEIIKPKAVVAVQTIIRDPEFLYLLISADVSYDKNKTSLTEEQLKTAIRNAILGYKTTYLDKFSGKFVQSRVQDAIDAVDRNAILGSTIVTRVQKKFTPDVTAAVPYRVDFGVPLRRGTIGNKLESTFFTVADSTGVDRQVQFDEIPQSFSGISSVKVINPGQGFISQPTVTIEGDGQGANAVAVIVNGQIKSIDVTNRGIDYTRATITISGGGGYGASATAVIDGRVGTIRTVYYDVRAQRQIVDENAGEIDYDTGVVTISNILIKDVDSVDGDIRLSVESEEGILSTIKNNIITIDENDPTSISTTLQAT
jgi:hypothetical protein